MEQWNTGMMEQRNTEMMERRNTETMERRNTEMMEQWNTEMMQQWNTEMMEQWNTEMMEQRNTEMMEQWSTGTMEWRNTEMMQQWNTEMMEQNNTEMIEHRNGGTLEHWSDERWNTDITEHRHTYAGTMEHWKDGTTEHRNSGTLETWNNRTGEHWKIETPERRNAETRRNAGIPDVRQPKPRRATCALLAAVTFREDGGDLMQHGGQAWPPVRLLDGDDAPSQHRPLQQAASEVSPRDDLLRLRPPNDPGRREPTAKCPPATNGSRHFANVSVIFLFDLAPFSNVALRVQHVIYIT